MIVNWRSYNLECIQNRIVAKVDELLARCTAFERKLGQAQVAGRQLTAAVLYDALG